MTPTPEVACGHLPLEGAPRAAWRSQIRRGRLSREAVTPFAAAAHGCLPKDPR